MVSIIKLPVLAMMAGTVLAVTFPQHIERLEPYIAHSLPQTLQQFVLRPRQQQKQQPQPDNHRRNVAYYTEAPTTLTTVTTSTIQTTSEEPFYEEPETEQVQRQLPDEPEFQQITRASIDPTLRRQNRFLDLLWDTKKPIHQPKSIQMKSTNLHPKTKFTKKEKKDAIDSSRLVFEESTPQGGSFAENHLSQTNFEELNFQTVGHDSSSLFRGNANSVYESPAHHFPAPHFEHTSSRHFEQTPAPQYEISPVPQFEHSPAPNFEHSPVPHFEHSSARQFDPSSTTHFDHSPTANFEHSPAPRFDISSSQASTSHSAHFSDIPSPHFSDIPSPHFSGIPSPHFSDTSSPHFSDIPSPHFSSGSGLRNRLGGYQPEPDYYGPAKYHFKYGVRDEYTGNDFGHQETRDGGDTKGVYHVQLPDGRRQIVNYYVNKGSGFVADIQYDGKAHFPPPTQYQGVGGFGAHGGLGRHGGREGFDGSHGFLHGGGESTINHISGGASEFDVPLPPGLDIHGASPYSSGGLSSSFHSLH